MIEYYFVIYENGGGYKGVVYDNDGERVEDFWKGLKNDIKRA